MATSCGRTYTAARFALELYGVHVGSLRSFEGGEPVGEVIEERAVGLRVGKHLGCVAFAPIVIEVGSNMDAAKMAATMRITIQPVSTRVVAGSGTAHPVSNPTSMFSSNFRFAVSGLEAACARVSAVGAMVIRRSKVLDIPDLVFWVPEQDAPAFEQWRDDFTFANVGLIRRARDRQETAGEVRARRRVEAHCDEIALIAVAQDPAPPPAPAPAPAPAPDAIATATVEALTAAVVSALRDGRQLTVASTPTAIATRLPLARRIPRGRGCPRGRRAGPTRSGSQRLRRRSRCRRGRGVPNRSAAPR